jgi:pSer/pThr/pTyr-binding forkhead associated (FHA) protein
VSKRNGAGKEGNTRAHAEHSLGGICVRSFDSPRVIMAALLCGAGGLIAFMLLEPSIGAREAQEMGQRIPSSGNALASAMTMFALVGALVGAGLGVADEIGVGGYGRLLLRCLIGAAGGAVCGAVGGLIGQAAFSALLAGNGPNIISVIGARTIGWAAVGAGIGLVGGVFGLSWRKCWQGFIGGAIGGGAAGLMFDIVSIPFNSGTASRLIGDVLIGLFTGAAVTWVEEAAKLAWVTVLVGRNEGKRFIINKPVTSIGRDELADVPLFGDMSVEKRHASIRTSDWKSFVLVDEGSRSGTMVNGARTTNQQLTDGSVITIGKFNLAFGCKAGAHAGAYQPSVTAQPYQMPYQATAQYPYVPPPQQTQGGGACPFCGGLPDPVTGKCACSPDAAPQSGVPAPTQTLTSASGASLTAESGPHAGTVFEFASDRVDVGRDPSNSIVLDRDGAVSRRHASILLEAGVYYVQDNDSSNGTFLNGARVTRAPLLPGAVLHIGSTSLRFNGR